MSGSEPRTPFTCVQVAEAFGLKFSRQSGKERLYHCPGSAHKRGDLHPSLNINPDEGDEGKWFCGPCGGKGKAWTLAAFLGGVNPDDKDAMMNLLRSKDLSPALKDMPKPKVVATYPYVDENGNLLYEKLRLEPGKNGRPKDFSLRHSNGDGSWTYSIKGISPVPYHLPELLASTDLFWVEGEKDVDHLASLDLPAATSGASNSWRAEFANYFNSTQHVIIIPDNDDSGRSYATRVASALYGKVESLRWLELPDLKTGGDVSDWIDERRAAGLDGETIAEELSRLGADASPWTPETAIQNTPQSYIAMAPPFLAIEEAPMDYIIPELTPVGVIKCSHGDPRTMKSLAALEEAIAAATRTPAFGMDRFRPSRPFRVLYCSQEDVADQVRRRAKALFRSRGIDVYPETLAFSVHQGIDFDDLAWQERFYADVLRLHFELVIIDPIRSFTANADKGPSEVMPLVKFFRRFIIQRITIHIVHHDTKPPVAGPDSRRRSHRASGGAWFSASECPVSFEKLTDRQCLVRPEDYKSSSDPQPFTIEYTEVASPGGIATPGIRLRGESASADEAQNLATDEKVLHYLADNPGSTGNAVSKATHARREAISDSLHRLLLTNQLDCIQNGRKQLWFPKS